MALYLLQRDGMSDPYDSGISEGSDLVGGLEAKSTPTAEESTTGPIVMDVISQ